MADKVAYVWTTRAKRIGNCVPIWMRLVSPPWSLCQLASWREIKVVEPHLISAAFFSVRISSPKFGSVLKETVGSSIITQLESIAR